MTGTPPLAADPTTTRPPSARRWFAIASVAVGTFVLVTAEQLPIGLLTFVGSAMAVSEGTAGLMVTVPSIVAAIAAPLIPVLAGRLDRRVLLVALMGLMVVANVLSTVAPSFTALLASRVLVGVAIGGFWAVAGGLAVRLVDTPYVPRATAVIFGGVAAANVLGVPIGTVIGDAAGWRTAFGALSVLALVVLVALLTLLPPLAPARPVSLRQLGAQFRNRWVATGLLATFLIVTGHFAAYTFVSPILQDVAGFGEPLVGPLLFAFGGAGLIGNFVVGAVLGRRLLATLLVIVVALLAAMGLYPILGTGPAVGIALLVVWGLAFGGISVSLQTWMIKAAPHAIEAASASWVAVFNLSIGLGALVGGITVDAAALPGVLWLGAALVLLAALVMSTARTNPDLR